MDQLLILFIAWYCVFIFTTVCHEAAHALTAWKLGDSTAYRSGQVSLDPVPHMRREPFGMVLVPILSFFFNDGSWMMGWASAPYNPEWAYRFPKRCALMAVAGPLADFLLMIAAALLMRTGLALDYFEEPIDYRLDQIVTAPEGGFLGGVARILSIAFSLNLILGIFNLLPVPPLDGGALILLLLPHRLARKYLDFMWQPMFSLIGIVIAWKLFPEILWPIFGGALRLLYWT